MALTGARKVLHKVLKVPEHLQYQLAFISSVSSILPAPYSLLYPLSNRAITGTPHHLRPRPVPPLLLPFLPLKPQTHRRRLPHLLLRLRPRDRRNCLLQSRLRQQHPQSLLRAVGAQHRPRRRGPLRVLSRAVAGGRGKFERG